MRSPYLFDTGLTTMSAMTRVRGTLTRPGEAMSIRLGVQFGGWPLGPVSGERFFEFVDQLESLGFDSLWFSDRLISTAPTLGSISALAAVAARTRKLKFGSAVLVVPTRHPVELAKEIACIDMLSNGRMLPAFGLGTEDEREYEAAGV